MQIKKVLRKTLIFTLTLILAVQSSILPISAVEEEETGSIEQNTEQLTYEYIQTEDTVSPIIGEETALRDAYTKHFRHENGSFTAVVYDVPVHCYVDGEWKEIDNTLTLTAADVTKLPRYETAQSGTPVSFPQILTDSEEITVSARGYDLSFRMETQAELSASANVLQRAADLAEPRSVLQAQTNDSTVLYENVLANTDLQYDVTSSAVKESIIVKEKQENYVYRFYMNTDGLQAVANGDGSVSLIENGDTENPVFVVAVPYMFDAAGVFSDAVEMTLQQNGEQAELTLIADADWINSDERVFPVTVDPTLLIDVGASNIYDAYVDSSEPAENHPYDYYLYAGRNSLGTTRSFVKFNLPDLPDCSVVVDAQLHLAQNDYDAGNGDSAWLTVGVPAADWTESSITWNNQPSMNESIGYVDYTPFVSGTGSYNYLLNITKIVKQWYEQENGNYGLMLKAYDESVVKRTRFYSAEYNYASGYPVFQVTYVNSTGLEDYWSYETVDLGISGMLYINRYNGALTYVHSDIALGGNIMPMSLTHVYNSDEVSTQPVLGGGAKYGSGMRLNVSEKITRLATDHELYDSNYRFTLTDSDGTVHYFKSTSTANTYAYEFDDSVILRYVGNQGDHYFTLTYEDGSCRYYSLHGHLVKLQDANANTMTVTLNSDSRATSVTDGAGRVLTMNYDTGGYLTSVSVPSGASSTYALSYTYDASGNLIQITYPDNTSTKLYYDSNGMLTRVLAYDTTDVVITYKRVVCLNKIFYRVASVSRRSTGNSETATRSVYNTLTFEYRGADTLISDTNGNIACIGFDNAGRAVTAINQEGDIAVSDYNDEGNLNNTLNSSSSAFRFSDNLLQNSSFENGYTGWNQYISGSSGYTFTSVSSGAYSGTKAVVLSRTVAGSILVNQDYANVTPGAEYTFSAYFKIAEALTSGKFALSMEIYNGSTYLSTVRSMEYTATDGWERAQVSATLPSTATKIRVYAFLDSSAVGTVLLDAMQLEQSGAAGQYNILQNPGMTRATSAGALADWTGVGTVAWVSNSELNGSAVKLTGSPASNSYVYQDIAFSGTTDTTLVFGATAKGNAASGDVNDRKFRAEITLYNGSTVVDTASADYNVNAIGTQQAMVASVTASGNFTKIRLKLQYDKQINSALFDNAFLYADAFGTSYAYDRDTGKLSAVENDNGDAVHYTYTGPDVTRISYQKDNVEYDSVTYTYDAKHNLLTATTSAGIVTTYTYPSSGNKGLPTQVSVRSADSTLQSRVRYEYSSNYNYLLKETDALGNSVTYTYDTYLGILTSVTDPKGTATEYTYNVNKGLLTSVSTTVDGYEESDSYTYNTKKQLMSISHNGYKYKFTYDTFGRISKTSVESQALGTYAYNTDGTLASMTYGNGTVHSYTYDDLDRITSEKYNNTVTYSYYYNAAGQLGRHVDNENRTTWLYGYDLAGRLTDVQGSNGTRLSYAYDSHNNTQSYTAEKNGTVLSTASYSYTDEGLPTAATLGTGGAQLTYSYDGLNRLEKLETDMGANKISTEYYYDFSSDGMESGRVYWVDYTISYYEGVDRNGDPVYSDLPLRSADEYTYDENGNITLIENNSGSISYTYDELNRLIRENNELLNKTVVYSYDAGGNIYDKTVYNYTTGTLGTPIDTIVYDYDTTWDDKLLSYDGSAEFTYDAIGNPLTYRGNTFTWQKGRQLATVSGNGNSISYQYGADGLRTKKTVNGTTTEYTYASGLLVSQSDPTTTLNFTYSVDGIPRTVTYGQAQYYYLYNLQGDVIGIYNSQGSQVVSYTYDTWGKLISVTGTMASTLGAKNPFRYRGYVYDTETGFYYLTTRYYDPETGRFLNADGYISTGETLTGYNMFAYCNNNPIARSDASGDFWEAIVIGAAVGLASRYVNDVIDNMTSGASGLDILTPSSSGVAYLGAGVGGAIAAIPGLGFWETVAVGGIGSVVTGFTGGQIQSVDDLVESSFYGCIANGVGYAAQEIYLLLKAKTISSLPRTERKIFLRDNVYNANQKYANSYMHAFDELLLMQQADLLGKTYYSLKAGFYSIIVSTLYAEVSS